MATFFEIGVELQLGKENQLMKIHRLINWERLGGYLKQMKRNETAFGGREGYNELSMFKAILLGQWHNLSDPGLEESLRVRLDFMAFTGFQMGESIPDETTLCRFRNRLIEEKLDKTLMRIVNQELSRLGIQIEQARGAIIDATIVASSARPDAEEIVVMDREEEAEIHQMRHVESRASKDPDARWLKKGKQTYFGYKGFVSVTQGDGYIQATHVTSANVSEMTEFRAFIREIQSLEIFTDKGYACKANEDLLKSLNKKSRIMKKAARNRPLTRWEKRFNKLISKTRFKVEQTFGTLKRRFLMTRFRYITTPKVNAEMAFKAIGFNLLKAANTIK